MPATGRTFAMFAALVIGSISICFAQMDRASLSGNVTDSSGAVVPAAKVTVANPETKATFSATSNGSGVYNFIGLPIGTYVVSVEQEGFNKMVQSNVVLTANSDVRVDFNLTPGAVTQQVDVKAVAPLIEERSSAYGVDVEKKVLDDLPLQVSGGIRSVYSFMNVVPGVANAGFANNVMGGVGMYSQVLVDGVSAEYNPGVAGVMSDPPSVEAIGEFKVVNTISAEYGMTGGSFMTFVTKSGTNQLHGDGFEFLRNNHLDARSFFAPTVSIEKQNEFGFAVGGPVILPKVYDGRNKTFFFATFTQYIYHNISEGQVLTLPTDAFKAGDFSALLGSPIGTDALGRTVLAGQLYDPNSTRSDGSGGLIRDPFPGNIIPKSRQSQVSLKWQSFLPSVPGNSIANNFTGASGLNVSTSKAYFFKGDQVIGTKGRLSGSYKGQRDYGDSSCVLPPEYCGSLNIQNPWSTRLAYTHIFAPNMIGEFNFGVDRTAGPGNVSTPAQSVFAQTIGLTGVYAPEAPFLTIQGGYPGDGLFGTHNPKQAEHNRNTKFNGSVAWFKGTHNVKMGGNFFRWDSNFHTDTLANGEFNFNASQTGLPGDLLSNTGFGYASFLLGDVGYAQLKGPEDHGERSWAMGYFIQDEWRINPRLTLNIGLRYDWQPQYTSPHHQGSSFDNTLPNPGAGNIPGALTFLTSDFTRFSKTYPWAFGPRFGFAYKLDSKTVMRGSYGLFYGPVSQFSGEIATRQGYVPRFAVASTDGVTAAFNWDGGLPAGFNITPALDPTIANGSATAFVGKNDGRPAQIQLINFGFQRELPKNILAEVAYVGNLSHHIATNTLEQVNQLDYSKYGHLGQLLTAPFDSPAAVAAGITSPYPGFQGTVAQALRPYPQYLGINDVNAMIGNSTYHALQVKLQKRFSSGLSFLIGYTLSKNLTDVDSTAGYFSSAVQDAYNRRAEKALSSIDSPEQVVASYTYELPVGPGKKYLSGNNVISKYVIGGWAVSGINTYKTGTPLGVVTSTVLPTTNDSLSLSGTSLRPNVVPGVNPLNGFTCGNLDPQKNSYLNPAAFSLPAPFTFGNAPRELSNARGCGTLDEDVSLMKYIRVREGISIRLGADAFNLFNRRNLGGPDTNLNDPGFGTISSAGPGRVLQLQVKILW